MTYRHSVAIAGLVSVALFAVVSCRGKSPTEPTADTGRAATAGAGTDEDSAVSAAAKVSMRWRMIDRCPIGLQWRIFDKTTRGTRWPTTGVYRVRAFGSTAKTIQCVSNHKVCYGGTTDPASAAYFGVGINGTKRCATCCTSCRPISVGVTVSCRRAGAGFAPAEEEFEVDFEDGEDLPSE